MSGRKVDLFILESIWDDKLTSERSVRPFFDGLCRLYNIKYTYHKFYTTEELGFFIDKSKNQKLSCRNYYIAAHGSRKYIHGINNKKIKAESLKDIFKNFQGRDIYFGSCYFINKKNVKELLDYTKADWIAGYDRAVDWFDSTIIDLAFWRYYLSGSSKKRIRETQGRVAEEIYKNYPLSRKLGFTVFDKYWYKRKIDNSLEEFEQKMSHGGN